MEFSAAIALVERTLPANFVNIRWAAHAQEVNVHLSNDNFKKSNENDVSVQKKTYLSKM